MYQNYIFDLFGTLADIHTNESKAYLWEKLAYFYSFNGANYTPKDLKKEYKRLCREEEVKLSVILEERRSAELEKKLSAKIGEQTAAILEETQEEHTGTKDDQEIEIKKVFEQLFRLRAVEPEPELVQQAGKIFRCLSLDYIRLYDGARELLELLRKEDRKIYLLSNAQRVYTEPELKLLKLYDCFDGIMISSDEGYKKPSPRLYRALLDRYCLNPKESIMIGNDAEADIKGAQNVGLDTLYIHSNLSPELKGEVKSTYSVMDGDVKKIGKLICDK